MTYLDLLAVALGVPILGLAWRLHRHTRLDAGEGSPAAARHEAAALVSVCLLALVAALPWDAVLLHRGTWRYPHGLTLGFLFGVPWEEVLFMVGQPVLVGLWLQTLPAPHRPGAGRSRARRGGATVWLGMAAAGLLLATHPATSYLGWLLAWAGPLLALQWAVGGDRLAVAGRTVALAVLGPTVYLGSVDRYALSAGLWQLSPRLTTGINVLGLPVEELLFFALTDLLVVGGLLLATDRVVWSRIRSWYRSTSEAADAVLLSRSCRSFGSVRPPASSRSATTRSAAGSTRELSPAPRTRPGD